MLKIGITGCGGRMGRALTGMIMDHAEAELSGGTEPVGSPLIGTLLRHPLGGDATDIPITSDAEKLFEVSDIVIDFTCPTATLLHSSYGVKYHTPMVIGTTGLSADDEAELAQAAQKIPMVYSSNYSLGMNILFYLTRTVAGMLDDDFDIEILEMHHRHKVDVPSGTALSLGRQAASGRGVSLDDVADRGRDGITGARTAGDIGFASLRGGNVAGEHVVSFNADDERLEIGHKAGSERVFAKGALRAALWVMGKDAGQYDMSDILNLPKS